MDAGGHRDVGKREVGVAPLRKHRQSGLAGRVRKCIATPAQFGHSCRIDPCHLQHDSESPRKDLSIGYNAT